MGIGLSKVFEEETVMNIYEKCPVLENDRILIRMIEKEDCEDLFEVYSDKNALPFFNSDNCNGDNFFYSTKERMMDAILFWISAYENRWFVRLSIIDKAISKVIGTIEVCYRVSEDAFNNMGILRVDVGSDYEKADVLFDIISLVTPQMYDMLGCSEIITKAPIYAVERIKAIQKFGFMKSEHLLKGGHDGYAYNGYWTVKQ